MATFLARVIGNLPSGETWTTGVHASGTGSLSAFLTAAGNFVDTLWNGDGGSATGLITDVPAGVGATSLVVYQLDDSTGKATARAEASLTLAGSDTGSPLPQEVAVVASLRTATPGPSGRGRMYLPPLGVNKCTTVGRVDAAAQANLAASVAAALGELNSGGFDPILFTPNTADRVITSVDVGDVFDAQRRRRDKLVETRISVAV
jgi:hypothetical protein